MEGAEEMLSLVVVALKVLQVKLKEMKASIQREGLLCS